MAEGRVANLGEGMSIEGLSVSPLDSSPYLRPYRLKFQQNGKKRVWDCVKAHASLSIILYNKSTQEMVVVKQFRPAVYASKLFAKVKEESGQDLSKVTEQTEVAQAALCPGVDGITYELCAGLVDKERPLEEIAQAEAWEECGYRVPLEGIKKVNSFLSSLGLSAVKHTIFYSEVTNEMHQGKGGGLATEQEEIEVVHLSMDQARDLLWDEGRLKSSGLCFAITWLLANHGLKLK